ncbi:Ger(x)C family spore germination protein [Brevibacillus laterosporus]|uniref:Ger(X)C family spore germination protein n=1 Tax=Brevibacillus laterosporus TaxID=1465 RepID=A0A502IS38_BRELA|nr:Ger(x)C family spore germination protein [Brevibacillus laterosporus]QDX95416.1 Ger(x)C family spore germination protein [Brevibacillus laterosporus]TPG89185.1 Ger(x)C family spore germination protein [Brevibacillus laterosporus]
MMHRVRQMIIVFLLVCLTGCYDQHELEKVTLALTVGLDLDQKNNLLVYQRSPVFSREAKTKTEKYGILATTIQQSYTNFDAVDTAYTEGGKTQSLLMSKRLLQNKRVFPYLDVLYRDPKNATSLRMIAVEGPVSDIINFDPVDKPRLSLFLAQLVDTAVHRHITQKVTLRQFHYMTTEKGMTPFMSEVKKEKKEVRVLGTALLDKRGYYRASLNLRESALLDLLRNNQKEPYTFTIPVHFPDSEDNSRKKNITLATTLKKQTVNTMYEQGVFQFDINMKLTAAITERTFRLNLESEKEKKKIEAMIEKEINKQVAALLTKLQRHQVDPIGLGLYARAYQYKEWKNVQEIWPATFSKASLRFSAHVDIKNIGALK